MKNLLALAVVCLFTSCASQKTYMPVGGSKADGTVKLAYEYGSFEKPVIDEYQAQELAVKKCSVWGYNGAEAFGTTMQSCQAANAYGCIRFLVTKEYQCTN